MPAASSAASTPRPRRPLWLRERLRRGGIRAISPVVDVTNYVMLELGQPMHGFDLGRLDQEIRVRLAEPGERLALLNGDEISLRPDTLVIADAAGPVALAGIMGGAPTGVGGQTRDILLESAYFAPAQLSGKARSYGLHTDSSHRFERGVDPCLQLQALERATQLLLDCVGGRPGPVVNVLAADHLPRRTALNLKTAHCARILGLDIPPETIADILVRLGMDLEPIGGGWRVTPPSARIDLVHEVDLIADVARIHGYDRIPVSHANSAAVTKGTPETAFDLDRARLLLVNRGFQEVITYSFVSPELQARIEPDTEGLALANPISADLSVMRLSLWSGLLHTARYNQARQQERVRIFETGLRFRPDPSGLRQEAVIGGLVIGSVAPEQWGHPAFPADFFSLKADVEALLALSGAGGGDGSGYRFVAASHPASASGAERVHRAGRPCGRAPGHAPSGPGRRA